MAATKIEDLLFSASGNAPHLLTHFRFAGGQISLRLEQVSDVPQTPAKVVRAAFANAIMESIDEDDRERDSWPLDIIGFDCYQEGVRWKFVLNCGTVEWSWNSEWPSVRTQAHDS
jgi:hypothetical protein